MPNIIDILARAQSLMNETALNSITPPRAGGIMYDTLLVLNQMQLEGASLLISKVYASVSAMEADTTPTSDLTGRALKPGQLVVIVTSDSSSSDMGSEYRFNGPGSWTYVGKVGGLPLDTVPTQNSTNGITSGGVYAAQAAIEEEVNEIKEGNVTVRLFDHSTFTSPNENILVGESDIKFANVGDYLEIKVNPNGTSGFWLYRATSYNQPGMRFSSSNVLQIRFSYTVSFTYQDAVHFNWNNIVVIKVVLTAINGSTYTYDIYADGVKVGTQDAGVLWFTQIGHNTIMDLYYIKLRIGGVERTLTKFGEMTGAVGVTDVYSSEQFDGFAPLNERVSDLEAEMSIVKKAMIGEDMYYRYIESSSTYNALHEFRIYQRIAGQYYIATRLIYYKFSSSSSYPDGYWRIERTDLVTIVDGMVTSIQGQIITAGENEFVLQWLAGSGYNFSGGYTGGYHGGETVEATGAFVEFIVDGNRVTPTADIPLTPCKTFAYNEFTPIYQHNDDSIAAWHLKETKFNDGGYEVVNDVKFIQALDYFAYPGIVCVSRWLSEYAMPEGVATITDMGDGEPTQAEQFKSNGHRIHYEGNGYATDVFSEFRAGADDSLCQRVVYNSTAYNKYYRRNPDTPGSIDNRLVAFTKVTIKKM